MTPIQGIQGALGSTLVSRTPNVAGPAVSGSAKGLLAQQVRGQQTTARAHSSQPPSSQPLSSYAPSIHQAALLRARGAGAAAPAASPLVLQPNSTQSPTGSQVAGDLDGDGVVSVNDAHTLLDHLFRGSAPPQGLANADANGDGQVNIADVVRIFQLGTQNAGSGPAGGVPTAP